MEEINLVKARRGKTICYICTLHTCYIFPIYICFIGLIIKMYTLYICCNEGRLEKIQFSCFDSVILHSVNRYKYEGRVYILPTIIILKVPHDIAVHGYKEATS